MQGNDAGQRCGIIAGGSLHPDDTTVGAEMRIRWRPALGAVVTLAFLATVIYGVNVGPSRPNVALTVVAGSELADVLNDPELMSDLRDQTGVTLDATYRGTLDGADRLVSGERYDLAWFSSDHYLTLLSRARNIPEPVSSEPVMRSPVVLGVTRSAAAELGWIDSPVTWSDVAERAGRGELRFAMTSPASSNSGFSALVGVAASFDPTPGGPLRAEDIDGARLTELFSGLTTTAGSSRYLTDTFLRQQDRIDAVINYESELLALNANPALREPLKLIYPSDGAVYADYPLTLVNPARAAAYHSVLDWLREPDTQRQLSEVTNRRPVDESVPRDEAIPDQSPPGLPLPADLTTADQLIFSYLDEFRRPARTFYVLDVSTSMLGPRITDLRRAFADLTGTDTSVTGQFARFRKNELVTIIPFASAVQPSRDFLIRDPELEPQVLIDLRAYVDGLPLGPGTALYDGLAAAYDRVQQDAAANEGYYTSIVLMTDGEANTGLDLSGFRARFEQSGMGSLNVPTFVVKFGEAQEAELREVAALAGGELFDATTGSLRTAFQEIRGYQ